eukprot:CAMPEP_0202686464 /NCGR_PEP_ID=MMETSP1385-20130828/2236_1 /ASSEMBLY_ACC=CAM_ASM_000861 /TAXON_ID=933848 /ORGANISM="Elphidium margaritaceum" /LENGTH=586 /DNA_ID=CAMNT_0049341041 /DNA_START=16 /DNA_END=1776 /DNA_ORIENTATION=+
MKRKLDEALPPAKKRRLGLGERDPRIIVPKLKISSVQNGIVQLCLLNYDDFEHQEIATGHGKVYKFELLHKRNDGDWRSVEFQNHEVDCNDYFYLKVRVDIKPYTLRFKMRSKLNMMSDEQWSAFCCVSSIAIDSSLIAHQFKCGDFVEFRDSNEYYSRSGQVIATLPDNHVRIKPTLQWHDVFGDNRSRNHNSHNSFQALQASDEDDDDDDDDNDDAEDDEDEAVQQGDDDVVPYEANMSEILETVNTLLDMEEDGVDQRAQSLTHEHEHDQEMVQSTSTSTSRIVEQDDGDGNDNQGDDSEASGEDGNDAPSFMWNGVRLRYYEPPDGEEADANDDARDPDDSMRAVIDRMMRRFARKKARFCDVHISRLYGDGIHLRSVLDISDNRHDVDRMMLLRTHDEHVLHTYDALQSVYRAYATKYASHRNRFEMEDANAYQLAYIARFVSANVCEYLLDTEHDRFNWKISCLRDSHDGRMQLNAVRSDIIRTRIEGIQHNIDGMGSYDIDNIIGFCDLCRLEITDYDWRFNCDQHMTNKHDICMTCAYNIVNQYEQLHTLLFTLLAQQLNNDCIQQLTNFVTGTVVKL